MWATISFVSNIFFCLWRWIQFHAGLGSIEATYLEVFFYPGGDLTCTPWKINMEPTNHPI